jgi:hypothetical protein
MQINISYPHGQHVKVTSPDFVGNEMSLEHIQERTLLLEGVQSSDYDVDKGLIDICHGGFNGDPLSEFVKKIRHIILAIFPDCQFA